MSKETVLKSIKDSYSFGQLFNELSKIEYVPNILHSFLNELYNEGKIYSRRLKASNLIMYYAYE